MDMKECKNCKKSFKPRRKTSKFCCRSCQGKWLFVNKISGRKKRGTYLECACCKKEFYVPQYRKNNAKYCSRSCLAKIHLPQYVAIYGFKKLNTPPHKYKYIVTPEGKQVREHRWIMEKFLNRKLLPFEHVHHKDGNPLNNTIKNLVVLTNSEHQKVEYYLNNPTS